LTGGDKGEGDSPFRLLNGCLVASLFRHCKACFVSRGNLITKLLDCHTPFSRSRQ